ncbi:MAG TPA: hypothetical protein VNK67_02905 [Burkholderiales bacterium]|nr:hypothetical protein [Burkholderiales bacterium]
MRAKKPARVPYASRTVAQQKKDKAAFLEALAETANVTWACRAAGLPRRVAYEWREADRAFAKAWEEAVELGTDALEDEAIRRGHQGVDKPVYQGGRKVGTVREYSDTLLIFMLKARRPEKFKDRAEIDHKIPLIKQFMEAVSGKSRGLPKPLQ